MQDRISGFKLRRLGSNLRACLFGAGLGLAPGLAEADLIDIDQQAPPGPLLTVPGFLPADSPLGQSFIPTRDSLDFVRLLTLDAMPNDDLGQILQVHIHEGDIAGPIIGSSLSLPLPNKFGFVVGGSDTLFQFPSSVPLVPEQSYVIQVEPDTLGSTWVVSNDFNVFTGYERGTQIFRRTVNPTFDLIFAEGPRATPALPLDVLRIRAVAPPGELDFNESMFFSEFREDLTSGVLGVVVILNSMPEITPERLRETDIVIVPVDNPSFTSVTLTFLQDFLKQGGGALVASNNGFDAVGPISGGSGAIIFGGASELATVTSPSSGPAGDLMQGDKVRVGFSHRLSESPSTGTTRLVGSDDKPLATSISFGPGDGVLITIGDTEGLQNETVQDVLVGQYDQSDNNRIFFLNAVDEVAPHENFQFFPDQSPGTVFELIGQQVAYVDEFGNVELEFLPTAGGETTLEPPSVNITATVESGALPGDKGFDFHVGFDAQCLEDMPDACAPFALHFESFDQFNPEMAGVGPNGQVTVDLTDFMVSDLTDILGDSIVAGSLQTLAVVSSASDPEPFVLVDDTVSFMLHDLSGLDFLKDFVFVLPDELMDGGLNFALKAMFSFPEGLGVSQTLELGDSLNISVSFAPAGPTVPEPATGWLLLSGLAGLVGFRSRRAIKRRAVRGRTA